MKKRRSLIFVFTIILLLLWSITLWAGANFAQVLSNINEDTAGMLKERIFAQTSSYSIPRNKVLLEIATGTW